MRTHNLKCWLKTLCAASRTQQGNILIPLILCSDQSSYSATNGEGLIQFRQSEIMKHRIFLAIELPQNVTTAIQKIQAVMIRQAPPIVRWTKTDLLHITLKFAGAVQDSDIQPIQRDLEHSASLFQTFSLEYKDMGVFPNKRNPRVLWLGITPNDSLTQLAKKGESIFASHGYEPEKRPFQAHLTIGRFKDGFAQPELQNFLINLTMIKEQIRTDQQVDHITLYESTLTPKGPIYTVLSRMPFKS